MLVICFRKFSLLSVFLLYEKWIPKILTKFNLKSIHFIPHSASLATFSAPILGTSHLDLLGFKPKKDKKYVTAFHNLYQRFFII